MTTLDVGPSWGGLILPDATITRLRAITAWLGNVEMLRAQGIELPRVLLVGPSGAGKTQIARALARESGRTLVDAGPALLRGALIGQSARMVRDVFERARKAGPCILFLDDIESSAAARSSGKSDHVTTEIVTELLAQMYQIRSSDVFLLAATSEPEQVDPAVLLRLGQRIEIRPPAADQRPHA
jgi:SpoVK/Ycf46/Vps4 family AAA+-type ATPase